jgi:cytochrome c-type biogenesis protein CcsB
VILFGAFVTRYFSFEGLMPIREGNVSDVILSDKTYVNLVVNNGQEQKDYEKEVLFGALNNNYFKVDDDFRGTPFKVEYLDFVPNAKPVFTKKEDGLEHLHLVLSGGTGRQDVYIPKGEVAQLGDTFFSFDKPTQGVMNFVSSPDGIYLQPNANGKYMIMQSREEFSVAQDSLKLAELLKLYTFPNTQFVIPELPVKGEKTLESATKQEKTKYQYDALFLNIKVGEASQQVMIQGAKNAISEPKHISLNGLNFTLNYGAKALKTPFALKLRDFQLERYPGTNSPSSYASEVTVMDQDKTFDYRIFMNHVLDYKGYRFFQASYDPDEGGTILSVNHDYWGTLITYIGYFLMSLGMFLTWFWRGSRFVDLTKKLNKLNKKAAIVLLFVAFGNQVKAQEIAENQTDTEKYVVAKEHAEKFGRLMIQDFGGRIKPVNTYALEALRKVYKKDSYEGLTAEQVVLSAQLDPYTWGEEYLIHVKPYALGKKNAADLNVQDGLTSAANFYRTGQYYLTDKVQEASIKKNMDRTATDKEIINLDERFNVWVSVLNGELLHIYPKAGHENNKWFSGIDQKAFVAQDTMILKMHQLYMTSLVDAVKTGDYTKADEYLGYISAYQKKQGASIMPPAKKLEMEIKYNRWNIFKKLMFYYMIIGFVLLGLAFWELFANRSKLAKYLIKLSMGLAIVGMLVHVIGLGARWYISGHAPWSNGYEAVVFVAFVSTLAGLIFSINRSKFTLAVTVIFASFLLGIAHGSMMNPEITNLVPVLKSYWLMIHVAVITSSYGFLGLSALLGLVVLFLYILRTKNNTTKINQTIDELTWVNESSMTVGLFTLSIGTFLGGVWANESWGRYWSWDPKEVWSLISMMVYVFILHMRLVPGLRGKFAFNLASLWSISTLIMTFFGVNFYLSGMHSYAAGDPVPIPVWIYYAVAFFFVFSVGSYVRYRQIKK